MNELSQRIDNLPPDQRARLAGRLREKRAEAAAALALRPRPDRSRFPLSFAQERLWFLDQFEPGSPFYNIPAALRLKGPLDVPALRRSLNEIVRRHEVLRATFANEKGRPRQSIAPELSLPLAVTDLRAMPGTDRQRRLRQLALEEAQKPFDLAMGPLVRASLVRMDADTHVLLLTLHHIVFDGWSTEVWVREMSAFYDAFSRKRRPAVPEPSIQYADYADWQRGRLQGEALKILIDYWKQRLDGRPALLELPIDHARPPVQSYRGAHHAFFVSPALHERLQALCQEEGATLFMTLLAAFQVLLSRYSGQTDICVGTPVANRTRIEVEPLIGFFVNTLVMRTDLSGEPTFRELLKRVREAALGAYAHQELPFEKLVEALQSQRDLSHSPLFQVMFVLQPAPPGQLRLGGVDLELMGLETGISKFDLMLTLNEDGGGLKGGFEFSTDIFRAATIQRMAAHFKALLEGAAAEPDQPVARLPLMGLDEERLVLTHWNRTHSRDGLDGCVHHLVESQADRTPDRVALLWEGRPLTYGELEKEANRLAHRLQACGVGPEVLVGMCLKRTPQMVVAMLAVLKAGGAYVPIDPTYPKERLSVMMEDADISILVTLEELRPLLPDPAGGIVLLDRDRADLSGLPGERPQSRASARNLSYVLFTSGSTGRPKGIAIEHRSVVALLHWSRRVFTAEELSGMLASTSVSWDLSVFEIFAALSWGGTVILSENALQLPELPDRRKVTLLNTVPSAAQELVRSGGIPESVRTINLAGEPLPAQLVDKLYGLPHVGRVYDLYGPGEDTTYSTITLRSAGGPESIGRPINNTQAYILDANLQPTPIGIVGELFLAGDGLARGYYRRPDLTAPAFVPDPFNPEPGSRMYQTGDLASYQPDGSIRYVGRRDHQVKIRGFRIELGDVKATLSRHPNLRDVVVMVREDRPGDKRLVAYVVAEKPPAPEALELRRFLGEKLPDYMLPSAFMTLEELPLTPNGKVDRRALPAPGQDRPESMRDFALPRSPLEQALASIWEEVLRVKGVGVFDNFFELGGHSLLATQVVSRLRETLNINLPVRDLFQTSTVAGLAEKIEAVYWAAGSVEAAKSAALSGHEEGEL